MNRRKMDYNNNHMYTQHTLCGFENEIKNNTVEGREKNLFLNPIENGI